MEPPDLSVVIVAGRNRKRLRRAIDSVLQQDGVRLELVVIELWDDGADLGVLPDDARIRIVRLGPDTAFGQARVAALGEVRSDVVAYLEEHCVALPGWARALAAAHRGPWACVGSEIHNLNPGSGWSDAIYLMGYSNWMPPGVPAEVPTNVAHNSSYKKAALDGIGAGLEDLLNAEPLLQHRLSRLGHRVYFEPESKVAHENETRLRSLKAVWWWNRSYGRIRARLEMWGLERRIAYLAVSPLIPWVRLGRQALHFARRHKPRLWQFVRAAPRMLVLYYLAAVGLAVGGVAGRREDDLRFTLVELGSDEDR